MPQINFALSRGFAKCGRLIWCFVPRAPRSQIRALPWAIIGRPVQGFQFAALPTQLYCLRKN